MIQILEKDRNITTADHTDILNILMIQFELMLTGFLFFENIQCHKSGTIFHRTAADGSGNSAVLSDQHMGTCTSGCGS